MAVTYCVGVKLEEGLIFASESRTHAGVDNYAKFCKMTVFARPGDRVLHLVAVRPIVRRDDGLPFCARQSACDLGKRLPAAQGPVEVDQQAGRGRRIQRRSKGVGELPGQSQCPGVPAAMAVEQCLVSLEQGLVIGRNRTATVLATDDKTQLAHGLVSLPASTGSPDRTGIRRIGATGGGRRRLDRTPANAIASGRTNQPARHS